MIRDKIDRRILEEVYDRIKQKTASKLEKKGDSAYVGTHETYGIIAEEFYELLKAMHENNTVNFDEELLDIAVACVIGMASLRRE